MELLCTSRPIEVRRGREIYEQEQDGRDSAARLRLQLVAGHAAAVGDRDAGDTNPVGYSYEGAKGLCSAVPTVPRSPIRSATARTLAGRACA